MNENTVKKCKKGDEKIEKLAEESKHFTRMYYHMNMNRFLLLVGIIWWKEKNDLLKIPRKKINFISCLKHADEKLVSLCIDVSSIYEGEVSMKF